MKRSSQGGRGMAALCAWLLGAGFPAWGAPPDAADPHTYFDFNHASVR